MKKFICLLLSLMMVMSMVILPIHADEPVPCYVNTRTVSAELVILSTGEAVVTFGYQGYEDLATSAEITVKIQKKTLGLFWTDVDNGQPNDTWSFNAFGNHYDNEVSMFLSSKGTYRAVVNFTIYGFGGGPDEVEKISQDKYS